MWAAIKTICKVTAISCLLAFFGGQLFQIDNISAQSTDVNAGLFSTTEAPTVNVTTPPPTSVVNTDTITVSGTTINTTSVSIYVDGVLSGTLSTLSGTFSMQVPLSIGDNTISIVAYSSYSDLTTEVVRIVTYHPDVVDPTDPTDPEGPDTDIPAEEEPVVPGVPSTGFFDNLKNNLSFANDKSFVHPAGSWLLVVLAILSLSAAIRPDLVKDITNIKKDRLMSARILLVLVAALFIYVAQLQ